MSVKFIAHAPADAAEAGNHHIDYDWIVVQQHLNYVVAVSPFS